AGDGQTLSRRFSARTRRIKQATRAVRKKESEIVSVVAETLSSIRVVKAFAREDYEVKRLEKETLESIEMTMRARSIKARLAPIVDVIVAVGTCIVLCYGARHVHRARVGRGAGLAGPAPGGRLGRLLALPRKDLKADARPVEDDRHYLEGGDRGRADQRIDSPGRPRARPPARPNCAALPR